MPPRTMNPFPDRRKNPAVAVPAENPAKKRIATLFTLGCRLNQYETEALRERLEARGYAVVPWGERADLAIVNTCTVTQLAEAKCRQIIRGFVKANPRAFCAVVGCYAQTGAETLAKIPGVDLVIGNKDKLRVLDFIGDGEKRAAPAKIVCGSLPAGNFTVPAPASENVPAVSTAPATSPLTRRANLKVQDGCNFMCSYCIIPKARGRARSRELGDLVSEAENLVSRGVRELTLTGVNIGTYAFGKKTLLDVVDAVASVRNLARIRIGSIEPKTISDGIFSRMADPAHPLMPFLHLPLQSGCDRILRDMRRHYTLGEYLDFIRKIEKRVPDICIGTDIMVGFPGETDEEFAQTCRVLRENPFAYAHVFTYSERAGTPAAARPDRVPVSVRQRRSATLRALSSAVHRAFLSRFIGREEEILFENPNGGFFAGYTRNYMRVVVPAEDFRGENPANRLRTVRLSRLVETEDALAGTPLP